MKNMYFTLAILTLIFIQLTGFKTFSQDEAYNKKIQAIINLTRFVDWSQNDAFRNGSKRLYVLTAKNAPLNYELKYENNASYRNWQVVCIEKIDDFENGSVVFVTKSKEKYTGAIIQISSKKDIITVSENSSTFCRNGGMINIQEHDEQIKFEINYKIIQNKSLDISSKLLALSKIYNE
jgi:hypothetical protein